MTTPYHARYFAHEITRRRRCNMAAYFLGTQNGRYRSARIVPELFFVHSELTTGVFLADLAAYTLGWGWRRTPMPQPARAELAPYATKLQDVQFAGAKQNIDGSGNWNLYRITYLDDLRSQSDRASGVRN